MNLIERFLRLSGYDTESCEILKEEALKTQEVIIEEIEKKAEYTKIIRPYGAGEKEFSKKVIEFRDVEHIVKKHISGQEARE